MVYVETLGKRETDEKFGRLWFTSLTRFHRVHDPLTWDFDEKHVTLLADLHRVYLEWR